MRLVNTEETMEVNWPTIPETTVETRADQELVSGEAIFIENAN